MSRLLAALACVLLLVGCGGGGDGEGEATPAWSHDPESTTLGPAAWSEIDPSYEQCAVGAEQSPVDITGAEETTLPPLEFDYPEETSLVVENTGHVIEATPQDGDLTLRIEDDEYQLVQFHFHAPSEHTIDGSSYAAEAHLVHESEDGELAVVGMLMHPTGSPATPLVDAVVEAAPEEAGAETELEGEWSIGELLFLTPGFSPPYHTYPGSLTTPGCTEGVRWIVIQSVLPTSQETVDRLHELIAAFPGYDGFENNNRPIQPLNERVIQNDPPF